MTDSISTLKQNQQSISLQQSIVSQPEPIYEDANDDDELDLVLTEEDAHRLGVAITRLVIIIFLIIILLQLVLFSKMIANFYALPHTSVLIRKMCCLIV